MSIVKKIKLELPYHIKNSLANINLLKKQVDLVINVMDARSPKTTDIYKDLLNVFEGIKILNIFSKSDLIPINLKNAFDFKKQKNRKRILNLIKEEFKQEIETCKKNNYSPHFQILIVGIPNVGKSTLINLLKGKKISISANKPGVTKKVIKYYLGDNLWLYDSPGVFINKNAGREIIDKLLLLNSIPTTINNYSEVLERAYEYLNAHYLKELKNLVKHEFVNYQEFINSLAKKYNFKTKNEKWDIERAENKFLKILQDGELKVFWDL